MGRESELREVCAVRSNEMRMFGNLEAELYMAYRALSDAAFYAKRLGMNDTAKMLCDHAEDVAKAVYGEYDPETWKKYEEDCNGIRTV